MKRAVHERNIYKCLSGALLAILFSLPAHGSEECKSEIVDFGNIPKIYLDIRVAYLVGRYQKLDLALDCLVNSSQRLSSGENPAVIAYRFYREGLHEPYGKDQDEAKIADWKIQVPDSDYAHFATLRKQYMKAWDTRGNKFANETSEERLSRFNDILLETESEILSESNRLQNTPISHQLLLAVILDARGTRTRPVDVFRSGIEKWPYYYNFYHVYLSRLIPKWGGSWESVDEFINHYSRLRSPEEEDSLYARLYFELHTRFADITETRVEWDRLRESLKSLASLYPTEEHIKIAASYACYFDDADFFTSLEFTAESDERQEYQYLEDVSLRQCSARYGN